MHHAHLDKFAYQDSWFHRLDSRIKTLITLAFTVVIVSLDRTSPLPLCLYAIGPFAILVWANVPLRFVGKHLLWLSPFILMLAISFPLFDHQPVEVALGPWIWTTTLGWLKGLTLVAKFLVTLAALLALMATTRFSDLLIGLQTLHMPQVLVLLLGFIYRYLFILIDTMGHMLRARQTRRHRHLGWRQEGHVATSMLGALLVRSLDAAERTQRAMQARGFVGQWPCAQTPTLTTRDWIFMAIALIFVATVKLGLVPMMQ